MVWGGVLSFSTQTELLVSGAWFPGAWALSVGAQRVADADKVSAAAAWVTWTGALLLLSRRLNHPK